MAEPHGPGLSEAALLGFRKFLLPGAPFPRRYFGAGGADGFAPDKDLIDAVQRQIDFVSVSHLEDPISRMFGTDTGKKVANRIGSETRALATINRLSVEVLAETVRATSAVSPDDRLLIVDADYLYPPVLMVLSPRIEDIGDTRIISDEIDLPLAAMNEAARKAVDPNRAADAGSPVGAAFKDMLDAGEHGLPEVLTIARPEIVLTRRPKMIPTCAPAFCVEIEAGTKISTAGIFCRDANDTLGVTGCYHGTGPVGTKVKVDLRDSVVDGADRVQDIVFIPLDEGINLPDLVGRAGLRTEGEPARGDVVRFSGATNPDMETRVQSTDPGIFRSRPSVQLRVQTDAVTDTGDSGSALIDADDRVLAFAFERTGYDEYPQFTDWIWADNALRALDLTPLQDEDE